MSVTFNPAQTSASVTLSNGNLDAVVPNYSCSTRATAGLTTGKAYWEFTITAITQYSQAILMLGICCDTTPVDGTTYNRSDVYNWYGYNGAGYGGASGASGIGALTAGDVVGFALDMTGKTLGVYRNNVLQVQISIPSVTTAFPFVTSGSSASNTVRANFGATAFSNTVPAGYSAYNNLMANANPVATTIPNKSKLKTQSEVINLASYFSDPNGDPLTYSANSNNTGAVTTSVSGSNLTINCVGVGTATITATANDGRGGITSTTFTVTVSPLVKYIFQDGTALKTWNGAVWTNIGSTPATEAQFTSNGMDSISSVTGAALQLLNDPVLLVYKNGSTNAPAVTTTGVPPAKLILPTGDIKISDYATSIDLFQITATVSGGGVLKLIASADSGVTWVAWDGFQWVSVDTSNLADVNAKGMTPNVFNSTTSAAWNALVLDGKKIRFGYYIDMAAAGDQARTDTLGVQLDMRGFWKKARRGVDYTYEYLDNIVLRINIMASGDFKINY